MIYKYSSVKKVIAKVFSDLDIQEGTHRINDWITWAGEAIEKIGAVPQFVHKIAGRNDIPLLEITNYQTLLPHDFHKMVQMAYSPTDEGPYYPMRSATGSFEKEIPSTVSTDVDDVAATSSLVILAMSVYDLTYEEALNKINTELEKEFGVDISRTPLWKHLKKMGLVLKKPRPVHAKADINAQEAFKKN